MSGGRNRVRSTLSLLARISPYMRERRGRLALVLLAALAVMAMKLLEPWPMKLIVDIYFFGVDPPAFLRPVLRDDPAGDKLTLAIMIASVVLIAALGGLFYYIQRLLTSSAALEATSALRVDVYSALHGLPVGFHDRQRLGEMLYRVTGDVQALRESFVSLPVQLAEKLFLIMGVLAVMLYLDWRLTLAGLVLLPGLGWTTRRLARPIRRLSAIRRAHEGTVTGLAVEMIGGLRQIQAFNAEAASAARFRRADRRGVDSAMAAARLGGLLQFSSAIILGIGTALLIGYAALRIGAGLLTPGDLLVFVVYLRSFYGPMRSLAGLATEVGQATAAAERIAEVLDEAPQIADRPLAVRAPRFKGEIAFRGVSLAHAGEGRGIVDVDLDIAPGEWVTLTGPSGAGKTTLVSLLPRFYDPDQGTVLIDGQDVRDFQLRSLRARISTLFQEPILFSMTVAENIYYGAPDASREDIEAAVRALDLQAVIDALPKGLDTPIAERGRNLSGGQRQCIALLRAMIRDAPILILDEPTNSLDPALGDIIVDAIERLSRGRTVITITHDPRLARRGDRIVRMEAGRIVSDGGAHDGRVRQDLG